MLLSTLTVLNLDDSGPGSLRQAIASAAAGDTINFQPGLSGTIVLTSGELDIAKDLTIAGPGAGALAVSGNDAGRVFNLSSATVQISGLTLTHGNAAGGSAGGALEASSAALTLDDCVFSDNQSNGDNGGAIESFGNSPLSVSDCTFTGNSAANNGGAIDSPGAFIAIIGCTFDHNSAAGSGPLNGGGALSIGDGTVDVTNSTFFGNTTSGQGGAINSNFAATFNLTSDTIDGNSAGGSGGGISTVAPFNLADTIVAGNSALAGPDISGTVNSQDYNLISDTSGTTLTGTTTHNLIGVDPLLGPLADNGGPTSTQALGVGSPALDDVPVNAAPVIDQRGEPRPFGSQADIGAFEASRNYFFVVNTNDSGAGSLRQALLDANATPNLAGGGDVIQFNIPGNGVQVVQPLSSLPGITDPVFLDGYSQPGAAPNTLSLGDNAVLLIEIDGSAAGAGVDGLMLAADGSTVRGLVINQFAGSGIVVQGRDNAIQGDFIGTDASGTGGAGNGGDGVTLQNNATGNTLGGLSAGQRNLISTNTGDGVQFVGPNVSGNVLAGNYIGTNADGTAALGNGFDGVAIGAAADNRIGTNADGVSDALERNVISGNGQFGIQVDFAGATGNVIAGNDIGTDVTGTASVGNGGGGVWLDQGAAGNTVGAGNVISGNSGNGVALSGTGTAENLVSGNLIGTDVNGTAALGNTGGGVWFDTGAAQNTIGGTAAGAGNTIAFNRKGVVVADPSATGDSILGNAVFGNTALGIDLGDDGPTPNGPGGTGTGANDLQNFPVLESVSGNTVSGILDGTAATTFRLEFFANTAYDPSGFGQGEVFLGSTVVTSTGGPTPFSFAYTPVAGKPFLTATATNLSTGDTSEFSGQDVPPTIGAPGTASVDEDRPLAFAGPNALTVSDADNNGSDAEQLTLSVTYGTLTFTTTAGLTFTGGANGTAAVTVTGTPAALNTALAGLTYTPPQDYDGPDALAIGLDDEAPAPLGGPQTATASVALTVNFVNDQPSFSGSDQAVPENSGPHVVPGWAGFNPGPGANEAGQTATYTVIGVSNPALFSVPPAVDANGTLTYALAPNVFGVSTFTVQVRDSGGTAHGGVNTSAAQTFRLAVTPVTAPLVVTPGVLVARAGCVLQVRGINFTPQTVVRVNGKPRPTRFLSSTLLLVRLPRITPVRVGAGQFIRVFTLREHMRLTVRAVTPGLPQLGPVRLRVTGAPRARKPHRRIVSTTP